MSYVLQEGRPYRKQTHYTVPSLAAQPAKPSTSAHRRTSGPIPNPPIAPVPGVPPTTAPAPNAMNVHPFSGVMPGAHNVRPNALPFGGMPVMPVPTEMPMTPGSNLPPLRMPQIMQSGAMPPPYGAMPPQPQHSMNGMFPTPVPGGPPLPQGTYVVKGGGGRPVQHNVKNCGSRPTLIASKANKNKWLVYFNGILTHSCIFNSLSRIVICSVVFSVEKLAAKGRSASYTGIAQRRR